MASALVILGFAGRSVSSEDSDVSVFVVVGSCGGAIAVSDGDMIVIM
jgi:hypothetical protein